MATTPGITVPVTAELTTAAADAVHEDDHVTDVLVQDIRDALAAEKAGAP